MSSRRSGRHTATESSASRPVPASKRAVLAEYRITHYDGKTVRFAFRDYAEGGKTSFKTLPVLAFIGRLLRHVPDRGFKMVRYSGLFATRWRADNLAAARRAIGQGQEQEAIAAADIEIPVSLTSWRERRQAQTGVDPLRCSHCGRSMLLRDAAFGSHKRIEELFRTAGHPLRPTSPALAMGP